MTDTSGLENHERSGVLLDWCTENQARNNTEYAEGPNGLTGWRRVSMSPKEERVRRELATVLHAFEQHGETLYTYHELRGEAMKSYVPIRRHPAGDLLRNVKLGHVREPIMRVHVMGPRTVDRFSERDDVIRFIKRDKMLPDALHLWAAEVNVWQRIGGL